MESKIALADGNAAPEGFRGAALGEIARDILRTRAAEALQYGGRDGYLPLRKRVAEWLTADGSPATVDELTIVTGAKQALDMAARALAQPGDSIIFSEPTYMNALRIFRRAGLTPITVSSDEHGTCVDEIENVLVERVNNGARMPRLIYEIPDFHNPTGTVLSQARRQKLAALAATYEIPVLEDNPYRWIRYEGTDVLPLRAFDRKGMVVSVGTFSKILGPGIRLGWVHARKDLLERVMTFKADGGSSPLTQMIVHEFFRNDDALAQNLTQLRGVLSPKRNAMLGSLERVFARFATWSTPAGGYYLWLHLKQAIDEKELSAAAGQKGVEYYAGSAFYADPVSGRDHIRLCFAHETVSRIERGVAALGSAVAEAVGAPAR